MRLFFRVRKCVSILVLMEVKRESKLAYAHARTGWVSILVLMEVKREQVSHRVVSIPF